MATKGHQKRLPDNVHLLRGTFKPCRHGKPGKKPLVGDEPPVMPDCLDAEGQAEWVRTLAVMGPARVLTMADKALLAQYCQLWSEFHADPRGFNVSRHAQLRICASELGLTPAARAKLTPNDDGENNPFDED